MMKENLSDEERDLRIVLYYQKRDEFLERLQIPLENWYTLEDEYRKTREKLGIDEITYFELLECLYELRQSLEIWENFKEMKIRYNLKSLQYMYGN